MNEILELVITAVIAVTAFTVIYKLVPFKPWGEEKPRFTLFPKYIASFDKSAAELEEALTKLEFKKNEKGIYTRGKVYGDFSAKSIKLSAAIDAKNNQIKVYASFFGILFDTGDIWQVTDDIVNG